MPAAPESLAFWREALQSMPSEPLFPAGDDPRGPRRAGQFKATFPEAAWRQALATGKRHGMAGMVILLAAFRLWLAEMAGRDSFTLAVPLYRDRSSGLRIGFSGTPTVLDGSIDRAWNIRELIVDTRMKPRRASAHREVSLAELDAVGREAGIAFPRPTAMFSYSPMPFDPACGALSIERVWPMARPRTDFDMAIRVGEWGRGTEREFTLEYDGGRFDRFDAHAAAERSFALVAAPDGDAPVAQLLCAGRAARPVTAHIAASFTAEPIAEVIEHRADRLDLPLQVTFAGYSQVLQELLSPDNGLRRNRDGVNIVLLRPEDWLRARPDRDRLPGDPAALARVLEAAADEHISALAALTDVSVLVAFAPASGALARLSSEVEARMAADTFLMSCRVLGRGVEHRMVNALGRLALESGLQAMELAFRATDRNAPVRRFLESLPADTRRTATHTIFRLDAATAAQLAFSPEPAEDEAGDVGAAATPSKIAAPRKAARLAPVPGAVFTAIATELASARAIARAVWPQGGAQPAPAVAVPDASGDLAAAMRQAMCAVLGRERFDEAIPFWRLGLTSRATLRLIADLRRATGLAVEFRDLQECVSFTDLVRRLAARHAGAADAPGRSPDAPSRAERDQTLVRGVLRQKVTRRPEPGVAMFMTGATGFLGAHLVVELVRRTHRPVICLIRADDDAAGAERLRAALLRSGHAAAAREMGRQLTVVTGDLDRPQLGLDDATFAHLARNVGLVLHNGATASFAASYDALRAANVLGTLETIRLAVAAGASLHFVSTVAVFDALSWLDGETAGEEELPESVGDLLHGYAQTKYVSERHIGTARARGLACSVYRPGNIVGDSRDGTWVPGDAMSRLLRGSLDTGFVPDRPGVLDLTPVDYVAGAIAALALGEPEANRNFHIVNPRRHSVADLADWRSANGHPLVATTLPDWLRRVESLCQEQPEHPAAPRLSVLRHAAADDSLPLVDLVEHRPTPECTGTARRLQLLGVACPDLDAAMFGRALDFLKAAGYLRDAPAPTAPKALEAHAPGLSG